MPFPPETVLVFDRDGELAVFESLARAADGLEAIDVDDGEYVAYAPDGRVVELTATGPEGEVHVAWAGRADPEDLARRLAFFQARQSRPGFLRRLLGRGDASA
ncbi:hypothetical protein [Streptomyces sp. NPDC003487]